MEQQSWVGYLIRLKLEWPSKIFTAEKKMKGQASNNLTTLTEITDNELLQNFITTCIPF